jgi:2-dehydro-3-deoxy-D-pentonate aldolase
MIGSMSHPNPQNKEHTPRRLRGIVPPMITPLRDRDALDVAGLERLIEHILAGGVHGLFILGTSGEAPNLSHHLRRELISRVCRQVGRRVPLLVGITDTSLVEAHQMAGHAADAGADAVVCAPPYYFATGQPELVRFVERLVEGLPLPLFLYNMPRMTKVQFEPETLRRVSGLERIVGIKDSSGDLEYFASLVPLKDERPDWSLFVGPEHLLVATLRLGGDGGVNGGAVFMPQLFVSLFEAVTNGDNARAEALEKQLLALGPIYSVGRHASAGVKAMKCACSLLGLCEDRMTEPFEAFHKTEREKVQTVLESIGLVVRNP